MILGNIGGKHNLDRNPTFSELSTDKFSNLISNFSKFKEPGQKPFTYSKRQFYTLSDDIKIFLLTY